MASAEMLSVINDEGVEVEIPPDEFWQYEPDARTDWVWWDQLPPEEQPPEFILETETGEQNG